MTASARKGPADWGLADRETAPETAPETAAGLFAGPGTMRALCRALDWGTTPLGPVAHWPPSLRTAAGLVFGAAFPMLLLWGPDLVQLYNDGYREVMGAKHPGGLGQATRECWPEVWHINAPIYARVRAGETVWHEEARYPLLRHGPDAPRPTTCTSRSRSAPCRTTPGRRTAHPSAACSSRCRT